MKVYLKYRSYKPLHSIYQSLVESSPEDVIYEYPAVKQRIRKFYNIYKKVKYHKLSQTPIRLLEKRLFANGKNENDIEIYEYINMIATKSPSKPYIVDMEHVAMLTGFAVNKQRQETVKNFLTNERCKGIICLSEAARITLKKFMGASYSSIEDKVHVIYPALPEISSNIKTNNSIINDKKGVTKFLFVGSPPYLKGLEELLLAVDNLNKEGLANSFELHVITDGYEPILAAHSLDLKNVHFYRPQFSKAEIMSKFFLPADALIMPSKIDTFGMAILDSMVCGTLVIATSQFAMRELVTDGVDGFLLKLSKPLYDNVLFPSKNDMEKVLKAHVLKELISELECTMRNIIEGKIDTRKIGANATKNFAKGGKFSIRIRNEALLKVYKEALR